MEAADLRAVATCPEVDLLVAVLVRAMEDATGLMASAGDDDDARQTVAHGQYFLFNPDGGWAESRRTILTALDIEESYFQRIARRYIAGRREGSLTARRSGGIGRRVSVKGAAAATPPLPPLPPHPRCDGCLPAVADRSAAC